MNRILIICSSFPPINATAIHRTLALVRRLARRNFDVLILTMQPDENVHIDIKLMQNVPENIRIVHIPNVGLVELVKKIFRMSKRDQGAKNPESTAEPTEKITPSGSASPGKFSSIKDWLCQWLQFPDNRIGWCINSAIRGFRRVWSFKPDMIYSTAPMWSSHLLGLFFAVVLKKYWVADCRDPWRGNPYRKFKHKSHNRVDAALERLMVKHASAVISNTPAVCRDFCKRYPNAICKFFTVTNGYDSATVEAVFNSHYKRNGICRMVHAGSFYGQRRPQPYFEALAQAAKENPDLREKMRFKQVGSDRYDGEKLSDIAQSYGVSDMLELTKPVGHRQALLEIHHGDVAIAASQEGQNSDLQIPRKFYEYFGMRKAMLITGGCCSAIKEVLGDHCGSAGIYLVPKTDGQVLKNVILDIYEKWQQGLLVNLSPPKVDLTEDRMARQIESIMHLATEL